MTKKYVHQVIHQMPTKSSPAFIRLCDEKEFTKNDWKNRGKSITCKKCLYILNKKKGH